jgi:hypothetical protein
MTVLHLTTAEQVLWARVPQNFQSDWTVETEAGTWRDSPDRRRIRIQLVKLQDPKLLAFMEKAKITPSADALALLLSETDLKGVMDSDISELFFVLGPAAVGKLIELMLTTSKTKADLEGIAALTTIRRSLYESLISTSH